MDWTSFAEFVSPLAVALFAVWLGYRYQRQLADRQAIRDSYFRTRSALAAMILCVERSERLSFAADLMRKATALRPVDVDGAVREEIRATSIVLNVGAGLGLGPTRGAYGPKRPWGEWDPAGPDLAQTHLLIQRDFNESLHQIDEEEARVLFGGLSTFGEDYRTIQSEVQELVEILSTVQANLTPDIAAKVDWAAIYDRMLVIQNGMAKGLGGNPNLVRGYMRHGSTAAWPEGTPKVSMDPPKGTSGPRSQT
ncbi:MAG TPA: hypothetical protein VGV89_08150 [Thermoplasmata archaeon]|nr:hypothetical protein [Thermoplasmata archaeon]